jgi:hypothetical protein
MKRFLILALTGFLMSCGGLKLATSSYTVITSNGSSAERDQYTFNFNKKAGDYLEIVEVKLINTEKGMDESVPFQVTEVNGDKTLLDIKGRDAFAVVASKPVGSEKTLATSAIIVYRTEKDGDKKYHSIKKIGE